MKVTVGICTWNRAAMLRRTLHGLTSLKCPKEVRWELIVADNNSTDHTPQVLGEFKDALPIRVLGVPQQGKAFAANAIVREADSDLIVWTDDDVDTCEDWLTEYVNGARTNRDCVVFGGPIVPLLPDKVPSWIKRGWPHISNAYGELALDESALEITSARLPWGANFAVRTDVQREFPFDERRGVRAGSRVGGYETSAVSRILEAGGRGRFIHKAIVHHRIQPDQLSMRFVRNFFRGLGASKSLAGRTDESQVATLLGKPRWLLRTALQEEVVFRVMRLVCPPERWVPQMTKASVLWGRLNSTSRRP